ncbi:DUF4202 domain-containing protein [Cohaesibacter intestini]|uniref:DUF4202 domain-containing protein n=1 Tax=Cohaesibacter intestini TaxID=2211145 RepID=UPI000DEA7202|nr:DUF4202 domain-containing protein [Cohaesibacter intestini]
MSTYEAVIEAIDQANAADPRLELAQGGAPIPKELLYGIRMSLMCEAFAPEADELTRIAARGQHIERWIIPRDDYPRDRPGYHQWRNALKRHHAQKVSSIMAAQGYDEDAQSVVSDMLLKKNLKRDPRAQLVEDVACLVFLQHYALDFAADHETSKVISILAKVLPKMSDAGQAHIANLELSDALMGAVEAARESLSAKEA